jgi:thymidylate synthase ThyX
MITARVILDSRSPEGARLTTMELRYPRFIHGEFLTHRQFARNSASSRAIPFAKFAGEVASYSVIPLKWGAEKPGMQAGDEIEDPTTATSVWLEARNAAVSYATNLHDLGVHKSICNRLLEPFQWMVTLVTATEWDNFFAQRCHPDAEIHMRTLAEAMRDALANSGPVLRQVHTPYAEMEEAGDRKRLSVARCARVSYLSHDGTRDLQKDFDLHDRLRASLHPSPFEHVATAATKFHQSGPFVGWKQYRKEIWP